MPSVFALGKAEWGGGLFVHSLSLRCCNSYQAVLQGASRASFPFGDPQCSAPSPGTAQCKGQDFSPPAAVLFAACQKLVLSPLSVYFPLKSQQ